MRNLLLSVALIVAPVGIFAVAYGRLAPKAGQVAAATAAPSLGDMSAFASIIIDVQGIAGKGDMVGAEKRITDFETAWDDAQATLRPVNASYWGNIDDAADAALKAVRAGTPDAAKVTMTLADLQAELADPARVPGAAPVAAVASVSGIVTTDANGRALPCEGMLKDLADKMAVATLPEATMTQVADFQTKALERCNADDDARADGFSAQALALMTAPL